MKRIPNPVALGIILLFIGIFLRILVASVGFTYDMDSYTIVGKIVNAGGNVYRDTARYNYGPLWFFILGSFYKFAAIFPDSFLVFRFSIVILLTIADVGIWFILYRKYSTLVSFLFFLNPLSIILTGYYSQFDNLALFLGMIAVLLYGKSKPYHLDRYYYLSLIFIGVSLITKHIAFLFPLWLAFGEKDVKKRIGIVCIPIALFIVAFLPFIQDGFLGIKQNVFQYASFNNAPLWQFLVPDYLKRYLRKEFMFFGMLLLGAFLFRRKKPMEQLLLYTGFLVTFSYAIADQYFAIILPFIAMYINPFFFVFTIIQTIFFFVMMYGGEKYVEGFLLSRSTMGFTLQSVCLFCGLLYLFYRRRFHHFTIRQLLFILLTVNSILYVGILYPSYRENSLILPIENEIRRGNYEQANTLYQTIEVNPPFAGSRFYDKLTFIRQNIEYYRAYRYALDAYQDRSLVRDWKTVQKKLEFVPKDFPEKEMSAVLLEYAATQL